MLNKKNKGFTLIELLAVIALLAIVGITSYSIIRRTMMKAKLKAIQTTEASLEKQIKDRVTLRDEVICYHSFGKEKTFSSNFINVCNKNSYVDEEAKKRGLKTKQVYGTKNCKELYNLPDDYRMSVYYQPAQHAIYMYFGINWEGKLKEYSEVKSLSKFNEYISDYNQVPIAYDTSVTISDLNKYRNKYKKEPMVIDVNNLFKNSEEDFYNLKIKWDSSNKELGNQKLTDYLKIINDIKENDDYQINEVADEVAEKLGTSDEVTIENACRALYGRDFD